MNWLDFSTGVFAGAVFAFGCVGVLAFMLNRELRQAEAAMASRTDKREPVPVPENVTVLQCVVAVALVMQNEFMRGTPYGTPGVPNMQSIVELAGLSPGQARSECAKHPAISRTLADLAGRWDGQPVGYSS